MPETNINIHLKLLDEFTANMQKFQGNLQKVSQRGIELGRTMKQVGREISILGQTMMWTGTAMTAPLILAFKSAEKYSVGVAREAERLNAVFIGLRVSIAESMLPTVKTFTELLGKLYVAFNNVSPATRETIVKTILLNGAFLLIGGTILMVIGKFIRLLGILIVLPSKFAFFMTLHPVLFAIAAGLALVVGTMELFGDRTVSILGKAKIAWDMLRIGVDKVAIAFLNLHKWQSYAMLNFKQANIFKEGIVALEGDIKKLQEDMQKVFETKKATGLLGELDDVKAAFADLGKYMKNMPTPDFNALIQKWKNMKLKIETEVKSMADVMNDTMKNVANQMGDSLGNFFTNVLSGQIDDAKQMFVEFGRAVLSIIMQVVAKLIISETLGRMWSSFNIMGLKFHQGGIIRAHGGLATDEVPIIAQTGEGILSRRGMSTLGRENFDRLNRGEVRGGGGTTININPVIQLWDTSDVVRNKKILTDIIASAIMNNSPLRRIIKENA